MRVLGPLLIVCCSLASARAAQDQRFPYEAVVDADEEFVRSGMGPKYYPTGKLTRGDKVTVRRHDPGGWYMIDPPPGSFSWIQAEYVQRGADQRGRLLANNVVVHVGSSVADERSVYQRTLSKGATVEILGEARVDGDRGPVLMYKIKPPSGEYRWLAGKSLVPVAGSRGKQPPQKFKPNVEPAPSIKGPVALDLDPQDDAFAPSPFQSESGGQHSPVKMGDQSPKNPPPEGSLEAQRDQLHELDRKFREMIQQEPALWTLAGVEQSYRALEASGDESIHKSVEQRLRTLQKYVKIQQDYDDFHRLTTETRQRDAQLASMQKQFEGQTGFSSPAEIAPQNSGAMPPVTSTAGSPGAKPAKPPGAKFDGAGIVVQLASPPAGAPPFALIAPDGRLLTYLQPPPGVDLQRYLRQSMGVIGERGYRDDLKADLLVIRKMEPVRLQGR